MRLVKRAFRFLKGQTGIGFVEVVVAVAILAFIGVSLLRAVNTNVTAAGNLDEKVVATNLATAYIEAIKAMPYAPSLELPSYPEPEDIITIPPQYDVYVDIDFSSESIIEGEITQIIWVDDYDELIDQTLQRITVTVSREGGKTVFSICAFKTKRVVPES